MADRDFPSVYAVANPPAACFPPLAGEVEADVAVVGGGITGLSAALHLAGAGLSVVVVEAERIGFGASGRNGGQVNPGLYVSPVALEVRFGAAAGAIVDLAWNAPARVFDLVARHGIACGARRSGTLRAAITPPTETALAELAAACGKHGMPTRLLDRDAIAARTGTARYRAALFDPRGGTLDPLAYVRGLARAAHAAGATIAEATRATALTRAGDLWRLATPAGAVVARRVLLATNGYTDKLRPPLARSIVPAVSAITATDPLPDAVAATILPGREALYETGWTTTYYRIDHAGRLLMGGRGPQRAPRSRADFGHLAAYARRLFPVLADVPFRHAWSGHVAMTADHLPVVAEVADGVTAILGYNGRGIAMGTTLGASFAAFVADGAPLPFANPPRPIAGHALWPLAVTARVHYGRLRDRLAR